MARALKKGEEERHVFPEKLYYRIGEVSRLTGLKPHVLRYWESEFKIIRPSKGGSLHRLYRKKDLDLILRIKRLLYDEGFTIAGARKKIRDIEGQNRIGEPIPAEKGFEEKDRELLIALRDELQGIRQMLD